MMRHLRLLGLISIAMLALFAVPTAVQAQSPVQDQYEPAPEADTDPGDDAGADEFPVSDSGDDAADDDAADDDAAPVDVRAVDVQAADTNGKLPFTGGSVPLVALIGLMLLAAGFAGVAATRKRRASGQQ